MTRQQIVTGVAGVIIGFVIGFFVSEGTRPPASLQPGQPVNAASGQLPDGHPSPEELEQLEHLQEHALQDPNNAQARIQLGNAYYDMGRFDRAIQWYEEALNLDPDNVDVNTDLGTAYLYSGNAPKGIALYRKSLSLDADHPQTLLNLGVAYYTIGNYAEAVEYWEQLVEKHPEIPNAAEIRKQIETARSQMKQESSGT